MSDARLVMFIKNSLQKGLGRTEIEQALMQKGWTGVQISEAFADAQTATSSSVSKPLGSNRTLYIVLGVLMIIFVIVGLLVVFWPTAECSSSRDCGPGYDCIDEECVIKSTTTTTTTTTTTPSAEEEEPECYFDKDCSTGYECEENECVKTLTTTTTTTTNVTTAYPNYLVDYIKFDSMSTSSLNIKVNISNNGDASSSKDQYTYCYVTNNVTSDAYTDLNKESLPDTKKSSVKTCNVNSTGLYTALLTKSPIKIIVNATVDYYNNITESLESDNSLVSSFELFKENVTFSLPSIVCSTDSGCVSSLGSGYECTSGYCAAYVAVQTASVGESCETLECASPYVCSDSNVCVECIDSTDCDSGEVCSSNVCVSYECSDLIDNDGDGLIDYLVDTGCESATDTSERSCVDSGCGSYVCDLTKDSCYTSCTTGTECAVGASCSGGVCKVLEICNDLIDNDGDGYIDMLDSDCYECTTSSECGTSEACVSHECVGIVQEISCVSDSDGDSPASGGYVLDSDSYYWFDFCDTGVNSGSYRQYLYETICDSNVLKKKVYFGDTDCSVGNAGIGSYSTTSGYTEGYTLGTYSQLNCNSAVDDPYSAKNLMVPSAAFDNVEDVCAKKRDESNYDYLLESVCDSGFVYQKVYECVYGCEDGVCCEDEECSNNVGGHTCDNEDDDDGDGKIDYYGLCETSYLVSSQIGGCSENIEGLSCESEYSKYSSTETSAPGTSLYSGTEEQKQLCLNYCENLNPKYDCFTITAVNGNDYCYYGEGVSTVTTSETATSTYYSCFELMSEAGITLDVTSTEYNSQCEALCDEKSLINTFYSRDEGCSSETDDTEVSIGGRFRAAAELEENIFMKILRFVVESSPVIDLFEQKK